MNLSKQENYNGMDTQKEWHRKVCQAQLWNRPHEEEWKVEDHTYQQDRRNSDNIEGTRNWRRSLDGQAAVGDDNSITSVIFGSGKRVNIVQPE